MPSLTRQRTHDSAWDRLVPETIFSPPSKLSPLLQAELVARQAHAAYQQAMQVFFSGRDRGEAALARLVWCRAESRLVNMRAQEAKPNEFDTSRWYAWGRP